MLLIPTTIIGILWAIFIIYWLVSAFSAKRSIRSGAFWKGGIVRILAAVILALLLNNNNFHNFLAGYPKQAAASGLAYVGVVLCAVGIAFAIWARVHLGKNWGMPTTIRENPELVTSGPYTYVRHPIYTGVILAALGSALAEGLIWLVVFIVFCAYFIYSATVEEKNMATLFPDQYPQYKQRTKMLIPFIF